MIKSILVYFSCMACLCAHRCGTILGWDNLTLATDCTTRPDMASRACSAWPGSRGYLYQRALRRHCFWNPTMLCDQNGLLKSALSQNLCGNCRGQHLRGNYWSSILWQIRMHSISVPDACSNLNSSEEINRNRSIWMGSPPTLRRWSIRQLRVSKPKRIWWGKHAWITQTRPMHSGIRGCRTRIEYGQRIWTCWNSFRLSLPVLGCIRLLLFSIVLLLFIYIYMHKSWSLHWRSRWATTIHMKRNI